MTGTKRKLAIINPSLLKRAKRSGPVTPALVRKSVLSVAEMKTRTVAYAETAIVNNANPIYFDYPQIPQGTNVSERIGNKVIAQGLRLAIVAHNNGTAVGSQLLVRMVLLSVNEGRYRSNADITNFFFEAGVDPTFAGNITDTLREVNREGVRVMMDRVIPLGLNVVSTGSEPFKYMEKRFKLNQKMVFRDTGTADATNVRYVLAVFARDPANDGAAVTCEFSATTRINFKDI